MKYKVQIFLSFLKSLPLNISLFGLKKGIKIPYLVNYNTTIKVKKNTIVIPAKFTEGKDKIRVSFKGYEGKRVTSLYNCRMMR